MRANIYKLIEPNTGNPIYVGVTFHRLEHRYKEHLSNIKSRSSNLYIYLDDNKIIPEISLLEQVDVSDRFVLGEKEKWWVSLLENDGYRLLNLYPFPQTPVFIPKYVYDEIKEYLDKNEYHYGVDEFLAQAGRQRLKNVKSRNKYNVR